MRGYGNRGVSIAEGKALVSSFDKARGVSLYPSRPQRIVEVEVQGGRIHIAIIRPDELSTGIHIGVLPVIVPIDLGQLLTARADDVARRGLEAIRRDVALIVSITDPVYANY